MKKTLSIIILIVLLSTTLLTFTACAEEADILTIYNWADYIYDYEDDFMAFYKEKTGRDVILKYVTFDTNETMLTKIMNNDASIDVACPSEYAIQKLLVADKLLKIDYFNDPFYTNSGNVEPDIVNKVKESFADYTASTGIDLTEYFVPYMYGTLGILFNADVITREQAEQAGWGLLWNKNANGLVSQDILGKIYMKDSIRDAYAATLLYLKEYDMLPEKYTKLTVEQLINTIDDTLLQLSQDVLIEQKDQLYGYEVDFGKNEMIAKQALVDLAWSGDAMYAIEEAEAVGINLDYIIPKVGGNVWFDGWVIPTTCKNLEGAKIFIDFLNNTSVGMYNMMEIGYTSAVNRDLIQQDEKALSIYYEVYEVYEDAELNLAEDIFDDIHQKVVDVTAKAREDRQAETTNDQFEIDLATKLLEVLPDSYTHEIVLDALQTARDDSLDYFFNDLRRYPTIDDPTLGVMHDFGDKNASVVTMWEKVRSTGISPWALLLYVLAFCVTVVGVMVAVYYIRAYRKKRVKLD